MQSPANIDTLVSSRICHDLISPIGAISNGLELMEELASSTPEMALIADSVENAKAKLQFFRVCFGHASPGAEQSAAELTNTANAMLQGPRLELRWRLTAPALPRAQVKLLYLLLLCVETALPVGGIIHIIQTDDRLSIKVESKRVQSSEAWQVFEGRRYVAISPAQVQFPLARDVAAQNGRKIHVKTGINTLNIML